MPIVQYVINTLFFTVYVAFRLRMSYFIGSLNQAHSTKVKVLKVNPKLDRYT